MPPFDPKSPADAQVLIAGAGIGGGPLARLAEQGHQIKFFEAGPPTRDWLCEVPLLHGRASDNTLTVDGYSPPKALLNYFVDHYEDLVHNLDLKLDEELKQIVYPRGQGPGGSGNVNANVAVAPDRSTLEGLYAQSGNDPRLHPDRMTKFFARAQDTGPIFSFLLTVGHVLKASKKLGKDNFARMGEDGWQQITRADPRLLLRDKQLLGIVFHILKYTNNPKNVSLGDIVARLMSLWDSNNPINDGREGFTLMPTSIKRGPKDGKGQKGQRASVLDRLQQVLEARPDTMAIECETKVHSLIFNDKGNRVEGVRVMKPHPDVLAQRQRIYTMKEATRYATPDVIDEHNRALETEVAKLRELEQTREPEITIQKASGGYVLSAGAFEDPMILIRSGIGPKAVLDRLGIKPVGGIYREAVGKNLKDRREITMSWHAKDKFALIEGLGFGKHPHDDEAMKVWERSGRGPYATNGVIASYQFKSDESQPDADIFAFFVPSPFRGYDAAYSTDAETYPQTFTAVLLDKNGKLISDDSKLMTPDEFAELRGRLGTVEPDPSDPTNMKAGINFNYQRPKPGETPPLYAAMERMEEMFADCDVLMQTVPGNPFKEMPTEGSLSQALGWLNQPGLFPTYPEDDLRSAMDWFNKVNVPVYDGNGNEHQLTINREDSNQRLELDGKPLDAKTLATMTFHGDLPMTPANLKAQLRREYLIEYQHSQQWGHHANGTASMGPDPENNVVGTDYRVHGIENLYCMSAASTPAAVNPGPFIQLYIAAAIGEVGAEVLNEQLVRNESTLAKVSPIATRIPMEMGRANTLGENLLLATDRARAHVGDSAGEISAPALAALIATHKKKGFTKKDLEVAEGVADRVTRDSTNGDMLRLLAREVRRLKQDQSFLLDLKVLARNVAGFLGANDHLTTEEVLENLALLDQVPIGDQAPAEQRGEV